MFKLIVLVLGLVIGFGTGVYWSVHHANQASSLSAAEEQQVLQQTQDMKDRISRLLAKQHQSSGIAGIGSNLLGNSGSSGATVDPELQELDQKAQSQLDMLKAKLGK